jgi:hypothetical protein
MMPLSQEEFAAVGSGPSQCDLILATLLTAPGHWFDMRHLGNVSGSRNVHSRVSDLRKRGHSIEHRNERHGRQCWSFFRVPSVQ